MKVFFLCRTGHHTSLIAAALLLGSLAERPAFADNLYNITGFDRIEFKDIGTPFYVGNDIKNNEIYTIGISRENQIMARAANDLICLMSSVPDDWQIIDTIPVVSRWTAAGLTVKRLHLNTLARAFFYLGARQEYGGLLKLVEEKKKTIYN